MPFPVNKMYIEEAETQLGAKLPRAYREKLIRENGGYIEASSDGWELYPVLDTSSKKRLKRTCNNIVLETKNSRKWRGFPADAVAIGDNMGGDKLIFLLFPENPEEFQPTLFWWNHETGGIFKITDDLDRVFK